MRFTLSNGGSIKFSDLAVKTLLKHKQNDKHLTESGGVLLGRLILQSKDIIVDEVTVPTTWDYATRYFFKKSKKGVQKLINRAWRESAGTKIYLGEWHTHPEKYPTPSEIDKTNWKRVLEKSRYEQESLYFVIVGISKIRIWEGNKQDPSFFKQL